MSVRRIVAVLLLLLACPRPAAAAYVVENRAIQSSGVTRNFILVYPANPPAGLPLVFSLHGDGGNGAGMRAALPLETEAAERAIFIYPDAPGGTFEYFTDAGRTREVQFVRDVVAAVDGQFQVDETRVFLTGFSGGATMANALGCRMGDDEIRAVGIHSGSLYPEGNDFTYTGNGGVSCPVPAVIFVWGMNDNTPGVTYQTGQNVRDNYLATHGCAANTTPRDPSPCVDYAGCARDVAWCAIPGLGHSIWNNAARAIWRFFDAQGAPPAVGVTVFDDALGAGWNGPGYSFGSPAPNFQNASPVHSGVASIAFTPAAGANPNAVSLAQTGANLDTGQFPILRLWVHGGAAGNQQVQVVLSIDKGATFLGSAPLASYLAGGAVTAGQWREAVIDLRAPPISRQGPYDRIDLQSAGASAGGVMYFDDIRLQAAGSATGLFADGFED